MSSSSNLSLCHSDPTQILDIPETGGAMGTVGYVSDASTGLFQKVEGQMLIGRHPDCDFTVNDRHSSLRHCSVERRGGHFFVRDLQSKNGTWLNGLRVQEAQLVNGSRLQIGQTALIFETHQPEPLKTELPIRSRDPVWSAMLHRLPHVAKTDLAVFVQGESGTGKEVLAQIIHDLSSRSEGPFVSVNCSALTETLVESELFGHVKGSFTGATSDRKGAFEAARGGTLFLDEIGDLPVSLQPKLLRALENREIRPVGSDRTVHTDVRIVTATHKNLETLVSQNLFRADLFFRIHVLKISIPPLRHRKPDFEDLLYHFCREYRVRISVAAIEMLKNHSWPGNIRELKNVVARASALYPQTYIQPDHIPSLVDKPLPTVTTAMPNDWLTQFNKPSSSSNDGSVLKSIERELIKSRLIANQGNQRRTAAELGIPKSTLHDRIKHYQIDVQSLLVGNVFEKDTPHAPGV